MSVFNIRSVGDSLKLGQLKGNHFDIVIRHLKNHMNDTASLSERVLEAIDNVKVRKHSLKTDCRGISLILSCKKKRSFM